jgi:hypothetical protein
MKPLSLTAVQRLLTKLTTGNALEQAVSAAATEADVNVPAIQSSQVVISSAPANTTDLNLQMTYPRVCISASTSQNTRLEKFRSFSGTITLAAEISASGSFLGDVEQWIHFYVAGMESVLRGNVGDWGDGMFFGGTYDVQFQPPKSGGFGYVQSAKLACQLHVSVS